VVGQSGRRGGGRGERHHELTTTPTYGDLQRGLIELAGRQQTDMAMANQVRVLASVRAFRWRDVGVKEGDENTTTAEATNTSRPRGSRAGRSRARRAHNLAGRKNTSPVSGENVEPPKTRQAATHGDWMCVGG